MNYAAQSVFSYLDEVSAGDNQFRDDIVDTFVNTVELDLEALIRTLRARDFRQMSERAQKLSGSVICVGAVRLADICFEIAARASAHDLRAVETAVARLRSEFCALKRTFAQRRAAERH